MHRLQEAVEITCGSTMQHGPHFRPFQGRLHLVGQGTCDRRNLPENAIGFRTAIYKFEGKTRKLTRPKGRNSRQPTGHMTQPTVCSRAYCCGCIVLAAPVLL